MANRQQLKRQQQFLSLMADPTSYFGKAKLTLFPNGEKGEIWISYGPHSFCIKAGVGPAGLSLHIDRHAGCAPISVSGNLDPDYEPIQAFDARAISLCQHYDDEWTRAFRIWYTTDMKRDSDGVEEDVVPHPGTPDEWNNNRAEWLKTLVASLSDTLVVGFVCPLETEMENVEVGAAREELLRRLIDGTIRLDVATCSKDENLRKPRTKNV